MKKILSKTKILLLSVLNKVRPFYFSEKEHRYKRMNGWLLVVILFFSTITFFLGWNASNKNQIEKIKKYEEEEKLVIIKNGDKFSEDKLILFISELNFKWPEIIYAQARLESGEKFDSEINIQNNNYFGMKKANVRINIQSGENLGHSTYSNWRTSVIDYALFSATYLSDFDTKSEYYQYIENHYSETPGYVNRVIALEKDYFEKLSKIDAKSSYDIYEQEQNFASENHKNKKTEISSKKPATDSVGIKNTNDSLN